MHKIDRCILSAASLPVIADEVVNLVSGLIPCDRISIITLDDEKGEVGLVRGRGWGEDHAFAMIQFALSRACPR